MSDDTPDVISEWSDLIEWLDQDESEPLLIMDEAQGPIPTPSPSLSMDREQTARVLEEFDPLDVRHYGDPEEERPPGVAPLCDSCEEEQAAEEIDGRDLCSTCIEEERSR